MGRKYASGTRVGKKVAGGLLFMCCRLLRTSPYFNMLRIFSILAQLLKCKREMKKFILLPLPPPKTSARCEQTFFFDIYEPLFGYLGENDPSADKRVGKKRLLYGFYSWVVWRFYMIIICKDGILYHSFLSWHNNCFTNGQEGSLFFFKSLQEA